MNELPPELKAMKALVVELAAALTCAVTDGHRDSYAHPGVGRHEPYLIAAPEWVRKARTALAKVQI